ncbi:uncharacterized protein LOC106169291 [Lingula anatina]|uniref:Uncharacterized protein LOC106169291 n=1 Tax=Lingula anatina TaxID=7574 RepID=A0A1S3J141_LINAN|nr:uncharacterized protein LOC106169291 [Lingula anatina]|eukprot:XP_013404162.1 uncharacterized protein LOC106169291 [Lingula anatina]
MAEETADYEYDVFISYSFKDSREVEQLSEDLKEEGVKCVLAERDFDPGKPVLESIINCFEHSRRSLLYITTHSIKSNWCRFEKSLSLAHAVKSEKQQVIPVYANITDEELEEVPGHLRALDPIDSRKERFFDTLLSRIKAPLVGLKKALPTGNVAHGLVWGYFYGYLNLILPGLKQRFQEWEDFDPHSRKGKYIPKFIILLPESCYCWSSMNDNDDRIQRAGNLKPFNKARAGKPEREYKNFLFTVTADDGELYYFSGEYSTPLMSMQELESGHLAEFDANAKCVQYELYCQVLKQALDSALPEGAKDTYLLLKYQDEMEGGSKKYPIADLIVKAIRDGLNTEASGNTTQQEHGLPTEFEKVKVGEEYDAFVWHSDDDGEEVDRLVEKLESYGDRQFRIIHRGKFEVDKMETKSIEEALKNSRNTILYVTKRFLESTPYLNTLLMHERLTDDIQQGRLTLVPVLVDVEPNELPSVLTNVIYIEKSKMTEDECFGRLVKALEAPILKLKSAQPAGDIATGMAWSYYYGYLKLILPGLKQRIEASNYWTQGGSNTVVIPKLVLLLPQSCYVWDKLQDSDQKIQYVGEVKFRVTRAGLPDRDYSSRLYKFQSESDGKEYVFASEYATALLHLYEMEKGRSAGLNAKEMMKQQKDFCRILGEILNNAEECLGNFILLPYDDTNCQFPITKELEKKLKELSDASHQGAT